MTPLALTLVLLGGWTGYSADVELPVPKGWKFDPTVLKPSPSVRAKDGSCSNSIWFDFIPGASVDYAKQLIETESIDVTAAIRRWDDHTYTDLELAKHPAIVLRSGDRSVYVVPVDGGALIAQAMASGKKLEACLPLQDGVAATLVELFFAPGPQAAVKRVVKTGTRPALKSVEATPRDLDEALEMLAKLVDAETLAEIRASEDESFMYRLHHGLGTGLRNSWGLWGGSPLAKHFQTMGVFHPDDMSGIILRSFWRKLHDRPIDLAEQVTSARRYWDLRRAPDAKPCANGGSAQALFGLEAPDRFVQVYACGQGVYLAHELDAGWYTPDAKLTKRIEALRREGNIVSAPLEPSSGGTVISVPIRER